MLVAIGIVTLIRRALAEVLCTVSLLLISFVSLVLCCAACIICAIQTVMGDQNQLNLLSSNSSSSVSKQFSKTKQIRVSFHVRSMCCVSIDCL